MRSKDRDELLIGLRERQKQMHEDLISHTAKLDGLIPKVESHSTWITVFKWGGSIVVGGLVGIAFKVISG